MNQAELLPRPKPRKFRLTLPVEPERDLHKMTAKLLDAILLEPAMWCTYPAGAAQLSPQQQARYSEIGLKRGFPDIFILHQYLYGIELKRQDGQLSRTRIGRTKRGAPRILEGQVDVFPKLLATGAFRAIEIARSVEDVVRWLDVWNVPHREVL